MPSSYQYPVEKHRELERRWGRLFQRNVLATGKAPAQQQADGSAGLADRRPATNVRPGPHPNRTCAVIPIGC